MTGVQTCALPISIPQKRAKSANGVEVSSGILFFSRLCVGFYGEGKEGEMVSGLRTSCLLPSGKDVLDNLRNFVEPNPTE